MKVSLLVFPLIFILNDFSKQQLLQIFRYFIYGCVFAISCCFMNAIYQSISYTDGVLLFDSYITPNSLMLKGGNYFFGKPFSVFHQSVYFSMYLNIALIGVLYLNLFAFKWKILLSALLVLVVFQISNKANIAITLMLLLGWFLIINKSVLFKVFSVVGFVTVCIGFLLIHPRTKSAINSVYTSGLVLDRESETSTGVRLLVWDAAAELVQKEFLLGVGADNAYESLKTIYKQKRYIQPFRQELNAHNQFLQIIIECGVLGLLILLVPLGVLLSSFKKQGIISAFVLIIVVNFLFEVVLNRYSGIMGYTFFCCLFIVLQSKLKITVPEKADPLLV